MGGPLILGIDPGSRFAGYGLLKFENSNGQWEHHAHGVLTFPQSLSFAEKLNSLAENLEQIIKSNRPKCMVVEKIFLGKNADTAFKLGQVRGVCMQKAAAHGLPVFEYAARKVKKVVTGSGGAEKDHVRLVVLNLLQIKTEAGFDATDALALAICHTRFMQEKALLKKYTEGVSL